MNCSRFYNFFLLLVNTLVLTLVGCSTQRSNLPTDNDIVEQWNREQVKMQALAQECQVTKNIYSPDSVYKPEHLTIMNSGFDGCKLKEQQLLTQALVF
jgi:hypothetical protein